MLSIKYVSIKEFLDTDVWTMNSVIQPAVGFGVMVAALLSRRVEAVALLLVVQFCALQQGEARFLSHLERRNSQQMLRERADCTRGTMVAFRGGHERRKRAQAEEGDLLAEIVANVLRAIVVTDLYAESDLLGGAAEGTMHHLTDGLECLPSWCTPGRVDAEDGGGVMIDRQPHVHRVPEQRPGSRQVAAPGHIERRWDDRPVVRARRTSVTSVARSLRAMLTHQAKHSRATYADALVAQLGRHLAMPIAQRWRNGRHLAEVLEQRRVDGSTPGAPPGSRSVLIGLAFKVHARAVKATFSAYTRRRHHTVLENRRRPRHFVDLRGAKGQGFLSYTRLISRFNAVSPRAFCNSEIFSSRAPTPRLFSPARPLARNTAPHDNAVAAVTGGCRESVSRSSRISGCSTAAIFLLFLRTSDLVSYQLRSLFASAISWVFTLDQVRVQRSATLGKYLLCKSTQIEGAQTCD